MSYVKSNGQWVSTDTTGPLFAAQAGVTAAGNTANQEVGKRHTARLTLNVTAVSGTTPSLTVNIQTAPDGVTWTTVGSFPAVTAVGTEHQVFVGLDRYMRAEWAAPTGTTPDFTFNITGEIV